MLFIYVNDITYILYICFKSLNQNSLRHQGLFKFLGCFFPDRSIGRCQHGALSPEGTGLVYNNMHVRG